MAFNNVPVNGWPQIKGIENIKDIPDMQSDISTLKTLVGDADSGLVKDVADLKTTVGDSNSGLVKAVTDTQALLAIRTNHSASETVCGLWLNNYLYRKVIPVPALPNATSADVDTGIADNITVRHLYGMCGTATGNYQLPIPRGNNIDAYYRDDLKKITIYAAQDLSTYSGYVVLEYTKNPAPEPGTREDDQSPEDDTKTATVKRTKKS